MENFFSNLQMNDDFMIVVGLFLLITIIISTIIVISLSKINGLEGILYQAKRIDTAKETKMSELKERLDEEKLKILDLERELFDFSEAKRKIELLESSLVHLKASSMEESKTYFEKIDEKKKTLEKINTKYILLEKNYSKLEENFKHLQKRNEELVGGNNSLKIKIREHEIKIREQEKQIFEQKKFKESE